MSHAEVARMRMETIKDTINAEYKKETFSIDTLIANCCLQWGTTPKTVKGYIKILKDAGQIKYG